MEIYKGSENPSIGVPVCRPSARNCLLSSSAKRPLDGLNRHPFDALSHKHLSEALPVEMIAEVGRPKVLRISRRECLQEPFVGQQNRISCLVFWKRRNRH